MAKRRIVIVGAAGRDFHNFNCMYRGKENYEVIAFTATQIPDIHGRHYPVELAGKLYPEGIPIVDESELATLINDQNVDECVFAYSDVPYQHVMQMAARVNALGADFRLLNHQNTMIKKNFSTIVAC